MNDKGMCLEGLRKTTENSSLDGGSPSQYFNTRSPDTDYNHSTATLGDNYEVKYFYFDFRLLK
jgi:hypothetical protein